MSSLQTFSYALPEVSELKASPLGRHITMYSHRDVCCWMDRAVPWMCFCDVLLNVTLGLFLMCSWGVGCLASWCRRSPRTCHRRVFCQRARCEFRDD
jgi:hypothetical protein